jgi:hypothetical protein
MSHCQKYFNSEANQCEVSATLPYRNKLKVSLNLVRCYIQITATVWLLLRQCVIYLLRLAVRLANPLFMSTGLL